VSIGWAIVSTGRHTDTLVAPAIGAAEDTHLVAVYSREQERAEAFAGKHGAQVTYTSLEALMADSRVDVVFIASPNFLHAPYTNWNHYVFRPFLQAAEHVLADLASMPVNGSKASLVATATTTFCLRSFGISFSLPPYGLAPTHGQRPERHLALQSCSAQ